MITATQNHTAPTVTALRRLSMRRSSARNGGMAIPLAWSLSPGRTSGRSAAAGTMVVVPDMRPILRLIVK